jgi:hypothetical protein
MQIERKKRQIALKDMNIPDNNRFTKQIYF